MRTIRYSIAGIILIAGSIFLYFHSKTSSLISTPFFNKYGQASDDVVRLLGHTGIRIQNDSLPPEENWPEARLTLKSRSLEEITDAVQGNINPEIAWKRPCSIQRWEQIPSSFSSKQLLLIRDICFNKLGFSQEILPKERNYRGIFVPGGILSWVRLRLAFLNKLIDTKLDRPKRVYTLTGDRHLCPQAGETKESLLNSNNGEILFHSNWAEPTQLPTTEAEMMKLVFSQSKSPYIKDEDIVSIHFSKKDHKPFAITEKTIKQWLEQNAPAAGTYLLVSNQPFVLYHELIVKRVLLEAKRTDIKIESVGSAEGLASKSDIKKQEQEISIILDNLARIFYELSKIKKLST
ncbi:MAG: hypothetical protein K2Q34_01870 [Alphaproteobacteria bacterium]|nr:hypothetical protein [Alphaproteobacteria bacterium]